MSETYPRVVIQAETHTFAFFRDHAQLEKLRQAGMTPEDEFKLAVMREYVAKLATARQS